MQLTEENDVSLVSHWDVSYLTFSFQIANKQKNLVKNTNTEKRQATVQTTETPVSGKTIVVDAGDDVPDEGVNLLH